MDAKLGLGLSEGGAANPPTMGPSYVYSWAVDFGRAPALNSDGGAFWDLGKTIATDFPYTNYWSAGLAGNEGTFTAGDGYRMQQNNNTIPPEIGAAQKIGFPMVTGAGTQQIDSLRLFKPHASHDGIPIGAVSETYPYVSVIMTNHSTTSYGLAATMNRNSLQMGDADSNDKIGGTASFSPEWVNGEATDANGGSVNKNINGDFFDVPVCCTWDMRRTSGASIENSWDDDVIGKVFDPNEISHFPANYTRFSITYHGFIISATPPGSDAAVLPIHTSRPAI